MGRYVRAVIGDLAARPNLTVTLFVRNPHDAPSYRTLCGDVEIAPLRAAGRPGFSAVWFPWNGVRFAVRAPSVVTINDDFAFAYPARGFVARRREQQPIRRAVRRATRIATISHWARASLIERLRITPERISVIPLSPDPFFSPAAETSPYAEPFVLAVGTREERKNIAFLIDTFGAAFPDCDVRLVLVGTLSAALRDRVRESSALVTECRDVGDEQLRRLYRTAATVAVPSLAEGFGLVAAEAQACGAAVIAADAAALPETVGNAAIVADPHDTHAWSTALRALVRDGALNARYRERAVRRWPADSRLRTAESLLALIERAIDDRP